jgi:hypothetical protein
MTDSETDAKARAAPSRRFPPLWHVERTPGGFMLDASGRASDYDAQAAAVSE